MQNMNIVANFRELPKEDDPGAEDFYRHRHVGRTDVVVPCRWGLLDNAKTHQDVRDLVFSTLVGLQTLSVVYFGGKFPYLFDEFGLPRTGWDMNFSQGTVDRNLSIVAPICKLAMYFIRTFGRLVARFGRLEAVNLVDGIVTTQGGMSDIVGLLLQYLMSGDITVAELCNRELEARRVILGGHELVTERDVVVETNRSLHSNDLCLSDVVLTRRPPTELGSRPLKMLKLALQGYLWRTDPETSSILAAVCQKPSQIVGKWEPLTRFERGQMLDAIDADGHFRVIGTDVMVQRFWGRHTLVRREELFKRVQQKCTPRLGYTGILTCEQDKLTNRTVDLLTWMRDMPQEWAEDLFNDLSRLKIAGYNAESQEVSKAIETARLRAAIRHGNDDDCFDMLFGPLNTTYSFACEYTDVLNFARLHYRRCLRILGACTSVDGTPLYALDSSHQLSEQAESIVKDVGTLEPILNDLHGRPTPRLYKLWKTEMW